MSAEVVCSTTHVGRTTLGSYLVPDRVCHGRMTHQRLLLDAWAYHEQVLSDQYPRPYDLRRNDLVALTGQSLKVPGCSQLD
ncbi:hypothetical protein HanRHA438_Chr03g0149091 [Helianthus annuus]|nr:hypothetical protein HanHA89_Chr03g0126041 [Helianthus annuus]KAJ0775788.1 hypothetical protein HanOQP8_Chr03g0126611 [Helianthus annuus]KAJ0938089.1 hypothetical protein HanRHA438_Chr03g0149091 [Helianthus annuus]